MNNENYINEETFEELVNGLEFIESFTLYGRKCLKYHIKRLQEENKQLKEQQKEFINYLKSMLNSEKDNFSVARVKDVLEKYKEIVGDK